MANLRMKDLTLTGLDNVYTFADEAPEYSSSETYKKGEYCIHDGGLYKCKQGITTSEVWNSDHWEEVYLGEEVSELSEEIEEVEEDVLASFDQKTISGVPIASFDDGADNVPVKFLSVNVDPVQDLHGQDAPYPAGGGKNKLPYELEYVSTSNALTFDKAIHLTPGSYTLSFGSTTASNWRFYIKAYDGDALSNYEELLNKVVYTFENSKLVDIDE